MRALATPIVVFVALLVLPSVAQARDVYISTQTALVSQSQIRSALPAWQRGVEDVRVWWGGEDATLRVGRAPRGDWQTTIRTTPSIFAPLGYHSTDPWDIPYGIVYAGYGDPVFTLDHELKEMLVDPLCNRTVQSDRLYLVEVADPVEDEAFGYYRTGLNGRRYLLSDFVGPDWYRGGRYFDFRHHVRHAHQLLPNGYVSYWDGNDWMQIFN